MNKAEKKVFIENLCNSVKEEVISKIDKMPENWDGVEIRELLAQKFRQEAYFFKNKRNPRFKEFENTVIVKNI